MTECHTFFIDAGHSFLQKGGARKCGRYPVRVATGLSMREGGCCWAVGRGNGKDCGWCQGKEVVGPLLCSTLADVLVIYTAERTERCIFLLNITNGDVCMLENAHIAG